MILSVNQKEKGKLVSKRLAPGVAGLNRGGPIGQRQLESAWLHRSEELPEGEEEVVKCWICLEPIKEEDSWSVLCDCTKGMEWDPAPRLKLPGRCLL